MLRCTRGPRGAPVVLYRNEFQIAWQRRSRAPCRSLMCMRSTMISVWCACTHCCGIEDILLEPHTCRMPTVVSSPSQMKCLIKENIANYAQLSEHRSTLNTRLDSIEQNTGATCMVCTRNYSSLVVGAWRTLNMSVWKVYCILYMRMWNLCYCLCQQHERI